MCHLTFLWQIRGEAAILHESAKCRFVYLFYSPKTYIAHACHSLFAPKPLLHPPLIPLFRFSFLFLPFTPPSPFHKGETEKWWRWRYAYIYFSSLARKKGIISWYLRGKDRCGLEYHTLFHKTSTTGWLHPSPRRQPVYLFYFLRFCLFSKI